MSASVKSRKALPQLQVGEVLTPWAFYRWTPFGVVSLGLWACLGFAPVMLLLMYLQNREEMLRSFQNEGLRALLIFTGVWLALFAVLVIAGALLMKRRLTAHPDGVLIQGPFGAERLFPSEGLIHSETLYSMAGLMQGMVHLRYADGKHRILDGAGFSQTSLDRAMDYLVRRSQTSHATA